MSNPLDQFRENQANVEALREFLTSEPGREFADMLRAVRSAMTQEDLCEARLLGRHDAFQRLEDLLFVSTVHLERRNPVSGKAAKTHLEPAKTRLP
jgi:hypothetical protein